MKTTIASLWNDSNWRVRVWSVLAMLALLLMEATADSLWYQALFYPRQVGWGGIYLVVLAVLALSMLLARAMARLKWRLRIRQAVFLVWILLAIVVSMKLLVYPRTNISLAEMISMPFRYFIYPDVEDVNFFHLLVVILLVARGVVLARGPLTLTEMQFSFQMGLIGLLLYGMLFATIHPFEATLGLYAYLFCGLTAMSLVRVATLSDLRGGRVPRFGGGWLTSMLLAALAVVGLAILAGWLASGRVVEIVATIFLVIMALLTALTLYLLSPLLEILARLLERLGDLLSQMFANLKNLQVPEAMLKLIEQLNDGLGKVVPFVLAARGLVLLGIVVAIVALILLALRMRKLYENKPVEEEDVGAAEHAPAPNPLRNLLRRLFGDAANRRLRSPGQLLAAARIRQIYRQMEQLSGKLGAARPPSSTPLEFLPTLESAIPGEQQDLERITGAYVKVRYGEFPETRGEVSEVEAAWERVRQAGRQALALHKKQK